MAKYCSQCPKSIYFLLLILWGCSSGIQLGKHDKIPQESTPEQLQLINEAIEAHDSGEFDTAIKNYKKVLAQNPNNTIALYELSYSYSAKQDWQRSLEMAIQGTDFDSPQLGAFYTVIGNSFDMLERPQKAITVYKMALKQFPNKYMLHYNLGLTLYNKGDIADSKTSFKSAITINPAHPSSHLALGHALYDENNIIVSLLAYCRFLILEPTSSRSSIARERILIIINCGTEYDPANSNKIMIHSFTDLPTTEGDFGAISLALGLTVANNILESKNPDDPNLAIINIFETFFQIMSEFSENDTQTGFGWEYYVPYFRQLQKDGYMSAFVQYIFQFENSDESEISEFLRWSENYYSVE